MSFVFRLLLSLFTLALAGRCAAHDASAYGGLYRSRDFGATWFSADSALFVGSALDLAIHPRDANHLLYGTDTRALRSTNGGLEWQAQATDLVFGPVHAVALSRDGSRAWLSISGGVFVTDDGQAWHSLPVPDSALPVRHILEYGDQLILATAGGVFSAPAAGGEFAAASADVPALAATSVAALGDTVVLCLDGRLWQRSEAATWLQQHQGLPAEIRVDVVATAAGSFWIAAGERIYYGDGRSAWQPLASTLPEPGLVLRGIAVDDSRRVVVIASHRGIYRSTDAGASWTLIEGNLPVHLEPGLLLRDPHEAQTLYAGFSLLPYDEVWRRAVAGTSVLQEVDPISLAGAAAFLGLLCIGGVFAVRRLAQRARR